MVPTKSDAVTEFFHWQRYLYFRPWYNDKRVVDAASGEGYGTNFISHFANLATGVEIDLQAVEHAKGRYPVAAYVAHDATTFDYSGADLVVSFETIEHVPDPVAFLKALGTCKGQIVVSTPNRKTHSPGNKLKDKPLNPFHVIEWTPKEFAAVVKAEFPDRQVRFLSQEARWPGLIREGLDDEAMYVIAVIGDGELPKYPKIGLSIPTVNNAAQLETAVATMLRYYPGELEFAVVANGSSQEALAKLRTLATNAPHFVTLLEESENTGYGVGANRGLAYLQSKGGFDYFGVSNDDIVVCPTTMLEVVACAQELQAMGQNPGLIAPVSNNVSGRQKVEIGQITDLDSLNMLSDAYYRVKKANATPWPQVRGLFFLMVPELLQTIGGFDPIFGLGNFEDDDLCLRSMLAGFTNWIVDGAFLFHYGSQTFSAQKIDYSASIMRNMEILCRKWSLTTIDQWLNLAKNPSAAPDIPLHIPLTSKLTPERPILVDGAPVDLFTQASDAEFAAWLSDQFRKSGSEGRRAVVHLLESSAKKISA